jgi:outer membrane murein-binding lipoprotein Lpp
MCSTLAGTVAQLTSTVEELSVDLDNTRNRIAELESEQKARAAEFAAANRYAFKTI